MQVEVVVTMFALGLMLGFVGAGGSGFIISVLVTGFGIPIHTALGTGLAAMLFSSTSGAVSHFREGNTVLKTGAIAAAAGAASSWFFSSQVSAAIPAEKLTYMTAGMLYLSAVILCVRVFGISSKRSDKESFQVTGEKYWIVCILIGFVCGSLSGLFGIGATPFIQIGLITGLRMPIAKSAGTTMFIIVPIALCGGIGYYGSGQLDMSLLYEVLGGITVGSYLGVKLTKRLPAVVLKLSMIIIPALGATLLLVG